MSEPMHISGEHETASLGPEDWRSVAGTDGDYEASSHGRIRSWVGPGRGGVRRSTPRVLNPHQQPIAGSRTTVNLPRPERCPSRQGERSRSSVCLGRIILESFGRPRPTEDHWLFFRNGNRLDFALENLEWRHRDDEAWRERASENGLRGGAAFRAQRQLAWALVFSCSTASLAFAQALGRGQAARKMNRNRVRDLGLYGLTEGDYDRMLRDQGGVCALCHKPETGRSNTGGPRRISVDHDHATGEVRGLLCARCNTDLGVFERNHHNGWNERARDYLFKVKRL